MNEADVNATERQSPQRARLAAAGQLRVRAAAVAAAGPAGCDRPRPESAPEHAPAQTGGRSQRASEQSQLPDTSIGSRGCQLQSRTVPAESRGARRARALSIDR